MVVIAGSTPAAAVQEIPQPPNGADAVLPVGAHCATSHGTTSYDLHATAIYRSDGHGAKVAELRWSYHAVDPVDEDAIPVDAKNNVTIKLVKADFSFTYASWSSPDDQEFFNGDVDRTYQHFPQWGVPVGPAELTRVRFVADFDKRDVADARCTADTPPVQAVQRVQAA